jgi:hypothetical protein
MSLRNDHQISHHPKNTFAGQLVCPHCQTAFPIKWRRYWSAPWGNYRCLKCWQLSHSTVNSWWTWVILFVAITLGGMVSLLFTTYVFHNEWMGSFFFLMGGLAVGLPLDKWLDGHLRHLKIRSQ